ncbi:aminotransferase class I/II-fold pyridoxal phosphate-dependent enzyme [Paenibacillus thiaminolyticus]|uniref:aminotransferase class I/II-fold pyridoxal phosphate-dependent enzyme n=1 Tax=Paenibacillus thiaminolyticus TaxID=49283 RepID=UPI003D29ABD5
MSPCAGCHPTGGSGGSAPYPDPACQELRQAAARRFGRSERQVFIGNGSDEILAFSFAAFFTPGAPVLFPNVTDI